tara:strand:- start:119 stop:451 length:333 start_codon:yes stop_codon:yes gene_type:complete
MAFRLYAIMAVVDDEYSRPENNILEEIFKQYNLSNYKVRNFYEDLLEEYTDDYTQALEDTINNITDKDLREEALINLKEIATSDNKLHKYETFIFDKIKEVWNLDVSNVK